MALIIDKVKYILLFFTLITLLSACSNKEKELNDIILENLEMLQLEEAKINIKRLREVNPKSKYLHSIKPMFLEKKKYFKQTKKTTQIETNPLDNPNNVKALESITNELKVKEALFSDEVLYVSLVDDGTNRKGYAEYLCFVLKDYKSPIINVRAIKFNPQKELKHNIRNGVLLGEAKCIY